MSMVASLASCTIYNNSEAAWMENEDGERVRVVSEGSVYMMVGLMVAAWIFVFGVFVLNMVPEYVRAERAQRRARIERAKRARRRARSPENTIKATKARPPRQGHQGGPQRPSAAEAGYRGGCERRSAKKSEAAT
jgi:hypothetical protein